MLTWIPIRWHCFSMAAGPIAIAWRVYDHATGAWFEVEAVSM